MNVARRRRLSMFLLGSVMAALPAFAQDAAQEPNLLPPEARTGTATVWVADSSSPLHGRLLFRDTRILRLDLDGYDAVAFGPRGRRIEIPLERIQRVDVAHHDSVVNGAILGGLWVAACVKFWCGQGLSRAPELPRDLIIGTAVGAAIGGAIDAAIYKEFTIKF